MIRDRDAFVRMGVPPTHLNVVNVQANNSVIVVISSTVRTVIQPLTMVVLVGSTRSSIFLIYNEPVHVENVIIFIVVYNKRCNIDIFMMNVREVMLDVFLSDKQTYTPQHYQYVSYF